MLLQQRAFIACSAKNIWVIPFASFPRLDRWVYLTCTSSGPSMGATEGEWLRKRSRESSVFC
jgi:hypothetical protein